MSERESPQEFAERMKVFLKNREEFPEEELLRYAGQWIAWSPDGTAIVASSAESEAVVYQTLQARGYDLAKCCVGYIDADAVDLGGALLFAEEDAEATQGEGPR
ncbi:MAG: hypothetical protein HYS12_14660 [Planctomycetes bacterium]|nr:hypothetical protein [Planctomycetota bacterium]